LKVKVKKIGEKEKEIELYDYLISKLERTFHGEGKIESIETIMNNTTEILAKLISTLTERKIINIKDLKMILVTSDSIKFMNLKGE